MRRALAGLGVAAVSAVVLLSAPATATADVIFDPAAADELAATLAEAYEAQGVCYGWQVEVDNVGNMETSVGSNFGAGTPLREASEFDNCDTTVEFLANIRWTSETSELEDSASYQVQSLPDGPTTADLNDLELISEEGLVGDNVDLEVYKAVSALPLLAAEAGVAEPLEASPAPDTAARAAGGEPTNSPGSDLLRQAGGAILFGAVLIAAGVVFAVWALRSSSARRRAAAAPTEAGGPPQYVPPEWYDPRTAPPNVRPSPPPPGPDRPGQRPRPETPPGGQPGNPPETRPEE